MNSWQAGAILFSIWLIGLMILRGIGDCIQRLGRIEKQRKLQSNKDL